MVYEIASKAHIISAVTSLILGACVVFMIKGTRLHKVFGYGYVIGMTLLNISALCIYRLTHHFGPFHGAAIASFITLIAGYVPAYRHNPRGAWLDYHYQFMCWSYAGLLAAGASEAMTRIPSTPFWPAVVVTSILIFLVSGYLISRQTPKDLLRS